MLDPDVLSPDDERLLQVAIAIADGTPVDWSARTPGETERSSEDVSRLAVRLQQVERLVRGHRTLQTHQLQAASPTSHDTLLTEARRTSGVTTEPLRVQWGPLIVLDKIGRGSFGDVYRAFDPRLDREVALKLIPERASDADTPAIEEGRLLARVRHPNVLTVYGAERIDGRVGIWTEYVRGETLADEVGRRGPLSAEEAARIGVDVCRALGAVHGAGLLHRDVKAPNVMRDADGRIVLGDFGTGVESDENAPVSEPQIAGTPLYLAPEVIQHSPATVATDLYSVGVLLYFLVTGDYPVRGRTFAEIRRAHAAGQCVPLGDARRDLPDGFVTIVEALLARGPDRRYGSAAVVEAALSEWFSLWRVQKDAPSSVNTAAAENVSSRRLARARAVAAGFLVLAIAAAGVWMFRQARATLAHGEPSQEVKEQTLAPTPSTIGTQATSIAPTDRGTEPEQTPQSRLGFRPRDLVLVTRFENRTDEPIFDGAIEYALERELSNSDVVGLVPRERVEDSLGLMKRAADTVVDRTVGREVALRDGHIKALLAGRVEKFGAIYVLTAHLVDPADDVVVATVTEEAVGLAATLAALHRQATRVRVSLGEQRDRIKGADPIIQPGVTRSLKAFQLYNQSYQLRLQGKWPAAFEIARQVVEEDPEFGSGWIWLAWTVRGTATGNAGLLTPVPAEVIAEYRPYLERARELATSIPDWERYWISGSYYTLLGDDTRAVPMYEALLKLRPDHFFGASLLISSLGRLNRSAKEVVAAQQRAADQRPTDLNLNYSIAQRLITTGDLKAAKPYIDRLRAMLTPELIATSPGRNAAMWLHLLPAYTAWERGDVRTSAALVEQVEHDVCATRDCDVIATWDIAFGRLREATTRWHNPDKMTLWASSENIPALRQTLSTRDISRENDPYYFLRAGLLDQAAEILKTIDRPGALANITIEHGRGFLALLAGRPDEAIPYLQHAVVYFKENRSYRYHVACDSLATAFERVGRSPDALKALRECATMKPTYNQNVTTYGWMKLRVHLADAYREAGHVAEARRVEQDLRNLLVLADEDFPLLLQLKDRR